MLTCLFHLTLEATKRDLDASGLFASCVGHIGDGNFHTTFMYQKSDPAERAKVEKCVHDQVERAIELEGTCTVSEVVVKLIKS